MPQVHSTSDSDAQQVMTLISKMNPHVTLSDIAFLMGVPYEPEPLYTNEFDIQ